MRNLKNQNFYSGYFSTESVSEGHPDKLADQIAEAILDYVMQKSPSAHLACEVTVMNQKIFIGGEIKINPKLLTKNFHNELIDLTKKVIKKDIIYSEQSWNDLTNLKIEVGIQTQSSEINKKVSFNSQIASGDNSTVYGWAENSVYTDYFPPYQYLANIFLKQINQLRKTKNYLNFAPDGKTQILVENNQIKRIVLCQQFLFLNSPLNIIKKQIFQDILSPLVKKIFKQTKNFEFVLIHFFNGGPVADTGLTGRKILIDSYGTFARHGGGSFAGKDISKSDRTLSLFARFIAKNIVILGLASSIEIQITSYIGQSKGFSIGYLSENGKTNEIKKIINYFSDWNFKDIIEKLKLSSVSFQKYASYGYFARSEFDAHWEKPFLIPVLKQLLNYSQKK